MTKAAWLGAAATAAAAIVAGAPAMAQSCDRLWRERNAIYKEAGYCFRTPRGIQAFGNAGCLYDDVGDVPLSARQRAAVADLLAEERARGCPR